MTAKPRRCGPGLAGSTLSVPPKAPAGARRPDLLTPKVPRGNALHRIQIGVTAMKRSTKRAGKTPTADAVLAPSESFTLDVEAADEPRARESGDDEFFHDDDEAEEAAPPEEPSAA